MAINKVIYAGEVLIDISDATVTPETLAERVVAYNAKGEIIVGTMKQGGGGGSQSSVTDDGNGNLFISGMTATYDNGALTVKLSETDNNGNVTIGG